MMRKIAFALVALALVAGCDKKIASTPRPPEDKLVCADEPNRPVGLGPVYIDSAGVERREVTDEENGTYLRGLRGTGQSCRDDVNWLRAWFKALD